MPTALPIRTTTTACGVKLAYEPSARLIYPLTLCCDAPAVSGGDGEDRAVCAHCGKSVALDMRASVFVGGDTLTRLAEMIAATLRVVRRSDYTCPCLEDCTHHTYWTLVERDD